MANNRGSVTYKASIESRRFLSIAVKIGQHILVRGGRDPSGLRQESRPLAASKTGSPRFTESLSNMTNLIG